MIQNIIVTVILIITILVIIYKFTNSLSSKKRKDCGGCTSNCAGCPLVELKNAKKAK